MNLRSRKNLVQKLIANKGYRDAYVAEHVRNGLSFQLRTIRERLGWSQARMGQEVGKPQNVISRLEDPDYGRPNVQTLLEIAAGLNMALLVKFVPFSKLLREYEDVSPDALAVKPINAEAAALEGWASVVATAISTDVPAGSHFILDSGVFANAGFLGTSASYWLAPDFIYSVGNSVTIGEIKETSDLGDFAAAKARHDALLSAQTPAPLDAAIQLPQAV